MKPYFMTMSGRRWNIATAKAGLSEVVRRAQRTPQVIERRGTPVAVVLSPESFEALRTAQGEVAKARAFFELSAEIRAAGGVELDLPKRSSRPDPLRKRGG